MIELGVNIDHVATLRQVRGTPFPDPVRAALLAEEAAMVDIVSGGRLDLGLGAGYRLPEYELYGKDMARRYDALLARVQREEAKAKSRTFSARKIHVFLPAGLCASLALASSGVTMNPAPNRLTPRLPRFSFALSPTASVTAAPTNPCGASRSSGNGSPAARQ